RAACSRPGAAPGRARRSAAAGRTPTWRARGRARSRPPARPPRGASRTRARRAPLTSGHPDMLPAVSSDTARAAAAAAAVTLVEPGMTIGLGSGRAVWSVIELLGQLPPDERPRAAFASERTRELARDAGLEEGFLDGETRLALAMDGADEV